MTDGHHTPLAYHQTLLGDSARMLAYERALRQLVRPGMRVLDLGTGTGVLAMLAARRGARVHAVESASVVGLAEQLVGANGLSDRVVVHRGDIRELAVVEPVDLVVGDFMGRFVVDDEMLQAVEAAGAWLKPGGRFCPSELVLRLAPVERTGGALDVFSQPLLGLDLRAALPYAHNFCYHTQLPPAMLLASAQDYATLRPPAVPKELSAELHFPVQAEGVFGGFAGWFEARLAPQVSLSTAPGTNSHWGQVLFPVPPVAVEPGDEVRVSLRCELDSLRWTWMGELGRQGRVLARFEQESVQRLGEREQPDARPEPRGAEAARRHAAAGAAASSAGNWELSLERYGQASVALTESDDAIASAVYEGLGLAAFGAGRFAQAARALLRACDGHHEDHEQALRYAVVALVNAGRVDEAARWRGVYEGCFGPHPSLPSS